MKYRGWKRVVGVVIACALLAPMIGNGVCAEKKATSVDTILKGMTLRQKITQKFMMDFRKWNDRDKKPQDMTVLNQEVANILKEYQFGSVILFAENIKTTEETITLTKAMQKATTDGGGVPLLIAADQEGGKVYRLGSGTALPGNMALAATGDSNTARQTGEIIGRELCAVGINTTLSPVIDVNNNANNPVINLRSFSDDADIVGKFGAKYIEGLNTYSIIGCAKHFPGHGDTQTDSHTNLPEVDKPKKELEANELKPYTIAIKNGIDMIMTAHILYPQLDDSTVYSKKTKKEERRPATLSKKILTDLLRGEMNFHGVIVTDAMNMKGITDSFSEKQATLEAFKAGADLVCMPVTGITDKAEWTSKMEAVIGAVEEAVAKGELSEKDIDESVKRILKLKKEKGILDYNAADYTVKKALAAVGSKENRSLERKIAAKAVTVIRNKKKVLPCEVEKNGKVLMLAPYNNERAQMVIGFNRAKKAGVVPKTAQVRVYCFSKDDYAVEGSLKEQLDWADTVIINSEVTNKSGMAYENWTSLGPKAFTEYCKRNNKTSIVMSVDKPYDVQLYPDADAVLAVYGCKGSGIDVTEQLLQGSIPASEMAYGPNIIAGVEVLFGVYGAAGSLPVNVPVFDEASKNYIEKIKYARGYGLHYEGKIQDIGKCSVRLSKKECVFTGKNICPSVIVQNQKGKKLVENKDYTVTYVNNKTVGKATAVISGKYKGTVKRTFSIYPKKANIAAVSVGKNSIVVKMEQSAQKLGGTRYEAGYRVVGTTKWKYMRSERKNLEIKGIGKQSKLEVKVRAYKKVEGETYYGKWQYFQ